MFNVIIDTREQQPWTFDQSTSINDVINHKLDTGDYSIEGLETILCIERKKSVSEIATNLTDKRFTKELERMRSFKYKFLILEFDYYHIDIYPEGSNIPNNKKKYIKIRGPFIMRELSNIQTNYGVHVITASNTNYANYVAINLMKRVAEAEGVNG